MQEIPSLGKAYSLVMTEEKQKINVRSRQSFMDSANFSASSEKKETNGSKEIGRYSKSGKKLNTDFFCDHCNFFGHVRENCYHLIGYPKDKKKNEGKSKDEKEKKKPKLDMANTASILTDEDCKLIKELIHRPSGPTIKETDWSG